MSIHSSKRKPFAPLIAGLAAVALSHGAAAAQSTASATTAAPIHNVVLVHGAYADASCWQDVIARLQKAGMHVTAVQNPLTSLDDSVAATKRVLAQQDGPTILVAHSWGGMVITQAGVDPKVAGLVYVAARGPDANEDYTALAAKFPTPPASAGLVKFDGYAQLNEHAFVHDFAGDLDPARAEVLYAEQAPIADTLFSARTTAAAWHTKPSWYAVSTEDRTISPELERFMAKRMKATTIEVPSSHLSMISHPDAITQLILEAAHDAH